MIKMNNKAILLTNFSMSYASKCKDVLSTNNDLIRLEQENCCKKCDSINEIKVYEWIKENTYTSPDDFNGNFILIFNPFGILISVNHIA